MTNADIFDFPYYFPLWNSKPLIENLVQISLPPEIDGFAPWEIVDVFFPQTKTYVACKTYTYAVS